jgi:4-azaleucine resistance transporter AzlC
VRSPARRRILRDALAIGLATGAYGLSFGVLSEAAGLSLLQTVALSALVFTGATQLSVIGTLAAGGGLAAALVNGLLLASRHVAYGISVARVVSGPLWRRLLGAQILIDESTAMAKAQDDEESSRLAFWATGISVYVCWNASTVVGALAGSTISDPAAFGLDVVFPAAFVALLAPQLRRPGAPAAALAGAVIAAALVPFTPPGVPMIAASLGVLVALCRPTRVPGAAS